MIIGLTGTKASGKGEVAEIIKKRGFAYFSLSDRVREEAAARGLVNYNIKDLQDIGNDLRKKFGNGALAKRTLEIAKGSENFIIDGIRNPSEIEELKRYGNFVLIAVDALPFERFIRLARRGRPSDPKTMPEFMKVDERDRGINEADSGQQVAKCMEKANFHIVNNGNVEHLRNKVEIVLSEILF